MKKIFTLLFYFALVLNADATHVTVNLAQAGTLSKYITDDVKYTIDSLTIKGDVNGDDIILIKDMCGCGVERETTTIGKALKYINMLECNIKAGGNPYYTSGNFKRETIDDTFSDYMLRDCASLEEIILPRTINSLGALSLSECRKLAKVQLPKNLNTIGTSAFFGDDKLTGIRIPQNVTSIGDGAFSLSGLEVFYSYITEPSKCTIKNCGRYPYTTLYVPKGTKELYEKANGWTQFKEILEFDTASVKSVQNGDNNIVMSYTGGSSMQFGNYYKLAVNIKISNNSNSDMTINNIYIYSESTKSKIKTYTISDDPTITSNNNKTYELDFDGTSIFPIDIHLTYTIDGNNYDSIVKYNSQFEDVTAISNIVNGESTTDRIYSIDGKRLTTPIKGINILKMSDGTTKKVLVK